jgi:HD-GYP domain-containing protein (c-di-GMP phosphodiesterase class II)
MTKLKMKSIKAGSSFSGVVYLDKRFILTVPGTPLSKEILQMLDFWEFLEIESDGELIAKPAPNEKKEAQMKTAFTMGDSEAEDKRSKAEGLYTAFKSYMEDVFTQFAQKNEFDYAGITQQVINAQNIIKADRLFLLRAPKVSKAESEYGYLASHAVRSMITSLLIGNYLKLSDEKLIELGIAALLHEIGMTKLPSTSKGYYNKRPLTQDEKKAIFSHPILSYNVLKSFDLPLEVCLAGLEHHERENGAGYPRRLTGDKISLYAKIIAVACSYEALTVDRPHREAKDGYAGMMDLLKNEGKQYNQTIIKALLYSLSIYPVGLYVLLSNGKKGQVVDVNPENPFYPIVQVFGVFTASGEIVTLKTSKTGVFITRPLRKGETNI